MDSVAVATLIKRNIVQKAGLPIRRIAGPSFYAVNGITTVYNEIVTLRLWVAGVVNEVQAFVDDAPSRLQMIFGWNAMGFSDASATQLLGK